MRTIIQKLILLFITLGLTACRTVTAYPKMEALGTAKQLEEQGRSGEARALRERAESLPETEKHTESILWPTDPKPMYDPYYFPEKQVPKKDIPTMPEKKSGHVIRN